MKKFLMFLMAVAFAVAMPACGEDEKNGPNGPNNDKPLELIGGGTEQEQVFYQDEADEEGGFAFYSPAPWTVEISETTRAVSWLRVTLDGVVVTEGPKGNNVLMIEMDENDTEANRSATIMIDCGGTSIIVTVTQDARTKEQAIEDGDYEERPVLPTLYNIVVTGGTSEPAGKAQAGTVVTLTSDKPEEGYKFVGWTVVEGGVTVSGNKFTMPANDVEIRAEFEATSSGGKRLVATMTMTNIEYDESGSSSAAMSPGVSRKARGSRFFNTGVRANAGASTRSETTETVTFNLKYDSENRLTEMTWTSADGQEYERYYCRWAAGEVTVESSIKTYEDYNNDYYTDETTSTYSIGSNGYASSGTSVWSGNIDVTHALSYNNGYLSKWVYGNQNNSYEDSYTWTNGNLTRLDSEWTEDWGAGEYSGESDVSYLYGSVANNPLCNIDFNVLAGYPYEGDAILALVGMCGKRCANMVSSYTFEDSEDSRYDEIYDVKYETDSEGFITKITATDRDGGYEDIIEITYK